MSIQFFYSSVKNADRASYSLSLALLKLKQIAPTKRFMKKKLPIRMNPIKYRDKTS